MPTLAELMPLTRGVGIPHLLMLSSFLFACGILCVTTRRNAVGVLMGVELVLNSANINFVAFTRYGSGDISGHIFAIFVIVLAAAEAAIALAIVLGIFGRFKTIDTVEATTLHG
jgi:NADH:ubiquinone oxidoreductase subunit K